MFCVVYQWKVKTGMEEQFRDTWRTITEAIFEQHGALGSRLHQSDDGTWLAYAQWPDRKHWEHHCDTLAVELARSKQAECLEEAVNVMFRLTVTDDLLKSAPYANNSQTHPKIPCAPKLRVARPTDRLPEVVRFYRDGLALQELGQFENHDGFAGVMLGEPNNLYHLEFTSCRGHHAGTAPTQDNLLVFYMPDQTAWQAAVSRMQSLGYQPVKSFNPYWDQLGRTFEDPDGYRVVLQNAEWTT